MKHLTLLALCLAMVFGLTAQSTGGLPEKTESFLWEQGQWVLNHEHQTQYSDRGLIELDIVYRSGQPSERSIWFYDDQDRLVRQQDQLRSGGLWQNKSQYLYSEFLDRNPMKVEYQEYIGGVWMTQWGTWQEYGYESDGQNQRVKTEIRKAFWPADGYYHEETRLTWSYGSDGLRKECLIEISDGQEGWQLTRRESYTWEKEGQPDIVFYEMFDGTGWSPGGRIHYRYLANNGIETTFYLWDPVSQVYSGSERTTTGYDDAGTMILNTKEVWKMSGWEMYSGSRWTPSYQNGLLVEAVREDWIQNPEDPQSGVLSWTNAERNLFSVFFTAGVEVHPSATIEMLIYPNPVDNGFLTVSGFPANGDFQLEVYSTLGSLMESIPVPFGKRQLFMNVQDLSAGNYIIIVRDKSGIVARQQIIRE